MKDFCAVLQKFSLYVKINSEKLELCKESILNLPPADFETQPTFSIFPKAYIGTLFSRQTQL